jgi:hypothetical protein
MDKLKKSVLLALAILVLLLATGGEHANMVLEAKAQVNIDLAEENEDAIPNSTMLSIDIFNSVIQVSHLVFHSDLNFEFDLPEIKETKAQAVFCSALNYTKYYKTLFRSIISPNAP